MGIRKYIKDYRTEYIVKPNGKPGVKAVYIGKYYRFISDEAALKKARFIYACLSGFANVCCVVPFFYVSPGADTLYVALPHAITLFPLIHLLLGVYNLFAHKPPLIREFRDKTEKRITGTSVGSMCGLGITAIGQIVSCVISGFTLPDIVTLILIVLACAAVGYIFFTRKVLATEECKKADNEE